jgi:hypothetical protein
MYPRVELMEGILTTIICKLQLLVTVHYCIRIIVSDY